jgi:hypothetical protein
VAATLIVRVPGPINKKAVFSPLRCLEDAIEGGRVGTLHSCGGSSAIGSHFMNSYQYWFETSDFEAAVARVRKLVRRSEVRAGLTLWQASRDWKGVRQLDLEA